jgi:hypothetical protein
VYGLPPAPKLPSANVPDGFGFSALTAALVAAGTVVAFRKERMDGMGGDPAGHSGPPGPEPPASSRPPGADTAAFMHAIHGANEASRARREQGSGASCGSGACGGPCGCHA